MYSCVFHVGPSVTYLVENIKDTQDLIEFYLEEMSRVLKFTNRVKDYENSRMNHSFLCLFIYLCLESISVAVEPNDHPLEELKKAMGYLRMRTLEQALVYDLMDRMNFGMLHFFNCCELLSVI